MNQGVTMFSVPGGVNAVPGSDNGFDSPEGESKPTAVPYKIPPVVWMIVFLVGGYLGLRWIMED